MARRTLAKVQFKDEVHGFDLTDLTKRQREIVNNVAQYTHYNGHKVRSGVRVVWFTGGVVGCKTVESYQSGTNYMTIEVKVSRELVFKVVCTYLRNGDLFETEVEKDEAGFWEDVVKQGSLVSPPWDD